MSDDLNRRQALALLDSAERQIAAARALLGGESPLMPARDQVLGARGADSDRCPKCSAKGTKQNTTPFGTTVQVFNCGECGYEYPT